MWKRTESEEPEMTSSPRVSEAAPKPVKEQAIIGPSLIVNGDVSGDEDLLIQGQVEGKVVLKNNSITVGKNGRVKADLYGKRVTVEGEVRGDLYGEESVIVRKSGNVQGNLHAPRVTLEDGAKFKGSIDMEGHPPRPDSKLESKPSPEVKSGSSDRPSSRPSTDATSSKERPGTSEKKISSGDLGLRMGDSPSKK